MGKTLILYVFHEENKNLDFFISHGLLKSKDKEFIFIFNNLHGNPTSDRWKFLEYYNNTHLFIRPNIGSDFQGWNECLFLPISSLTKKIIYSTDSTDSNEQQLHTLFEMFVFLNSTVKGPYLPLYVTSDWVDCFTSKLSDDVKITGIGINFLKGSPNSHMTNIIHKYYGFYPKDNVHVQSMAFSLDREGLDILMKYSLFRKNKNFAENKYELIISAEISMSSIFRHEHKSIYSYMFTQGLIKYNDIHYTDNLWSVKNFHPLLETMFIKNTLISDFPEQSRYDATLFRPQHF